jgi:hypothetical protein
VARSRNRCLPVAGFTTASGLRKRKKRKPYCFISKPSNAHQDVSDSLVGYTKDQEFRKQQELLTAAAQDAAHLSDIRYKGGAARGAFGFAFSISAMSRDVGDVGDVGDSSALPSPVIPRSKGLSSPHPNRPSCGTAAPGCGLPLSLLNADR